MEFAGICERLFRKAAVAVLNVTVACIGGLKEDFWKAACAEYCKRLGAWARVNIIELPETRLPDRPAPAQITAALETDGAKILGRLPKNAFLCALCVEGVKMDSQAFARELGRAMLDGELAFVIGGSNGLSQAVKEKAQLKLSLSDMTFPHMIARVLLLEQLYRALGILHGTKYHK